MIGYYVHHHGLGHRTRAVRIARRLGTAVVGFGSLPRPDGWPGQWCELPADTTDDPLDATAGGVLHWAPLDHPGHRRRLAAIAARLADDVRVLVVDTSAEVALLGRLLGVRTVLAAMRGDRGDRTHRAAYDAATILLAPWSERTADDDWPAAWRTKTVFTGAISRFDDHTATDPDDRGGRAGRRVLALWGAGGREVGHDDIAAAEAATPEWEWVVRSPHRPSPDLWRELSEAEVVVTHAGQNMVAEVAAARRPAVVVAQPRPFDEQLGTVRALRRVSACVALDRWPDPDEWPGLLDRARSMGGHRWEVWHDGDGAQRAAAAIEALHAEALHSETLHAEARP